MGWAITQTWHLVEKDVEDTLEAIGERVLAEKGVKPAVLRRRAEGMRAISEVFRVRERQCHVYISAQNLEKDGRICAELLQNAVIVTAVYVQCILAFKLLAACIWHCRTLGYVDITVP